MLVFKSVSIAPAIFLAALLLIFLPKIVQAADPGNSEKYTAMAARIEALRVENSARLEALEFPGRPGALRFASSVDQPALAANFKQNIFALKQDLESWIDEPQAAGNSDIPELEAEKQELLGRFYALATEFLEVAALSENSSVKNLAAQFCLEMSFENLRGIAPIAREKPIFIAKKNLAFNALYYV